MRIARVFPRRNKATPDDAMAFVGLPPGLGTLPEIDEVHVSVTFTYDRQYAEWLAKHWKALGFPVKIGGPAYDDHGGEFVPGMYVKPGYVMTSRGCNNNCWFCRVPKREGPIREIAIHDGHDVTDSNLLQCSDEHIRAVFEMLARQKCKPKFSGGLEAKILKPWHCEEMRKLSPERLYFAYDTPDDRDPLYEAGKMLRKAGITESSHVASCYVLIGWKGDTFEKAEWRLKDAQKAGFCPFAMLYEDENGAVSPSWEPFQKRWLTPAIVNAKPPKDQITFAIE